MKIYKINGVQYTAKEVLDNDNLQKVLIDNGIKLPIEDEIDDIVTVNSNNKDLATGDDYMESEYINGRHSKGRRQMIDESNQTASGVLIGAICGLGIGALFYYFTIKKLLRLDINKYDASRYAQNATKGYWIGTSMQILISIIVFSLLMHSNNSTDVGSDGGSSTAVLFWLPILCLWLYFVISATRWSHRLVAANSKLSAAKKRVSLNDALGPLD